MIKVINSLNMGKSDLGWLHSTFHFSFAEYHNPNNIQFGALRVINDDIFEAGGGFDTHPHNNMEIVSYVISGTLTHKDSLGNSRELTRGQVQYMSAGTGVRHSEFNRTDVPLRFLQIWIYPDKNGYSPSYGDFRFNWEDRENKWLNIVSGVTGDAQVKIRQDMVISVVHLPKGKSIDYSLEKNRQAYIVQIEGEGELNKNKLKEKDAAEITSDTNLSLEAKTDSHYILFDMVAA